MEILGKVHCFFEQSGTFKNEFIKLGIPAEDYDIQNNFQQTDHVIDLFAEIENAYDNKESIFDNISKDDLIVAFFPCIYFCEANVRLFRFEDSTHKKHSHRVAVDDMLERAKRRQFFFEIALKLFLVCEDSGLRLIVENPYNANHYLVQYFPYRYSFIDWDRSQRGDQFKKPTQYFYINCIPTEGYSLQPKKAIAVNSIDKRDRSKKEEAKRKEGICFCSTEKSTMTTDYARNFICDNILGKKQPNISKTLFD